VGFTTGNDALFKNFNKFTNFFFETGESAHDGCLPSSPSAEGDHAALLSARAKTSFKD
jgi:hypothetical protein